MLSFTEWNLTIISYVLNFEIYDNFSPVLNFQELLFYFFFYHEKLRLNSLNHFQNFFHILLVPQKIIGVKKITIFTHSLDFIQKIAQD